MEVAILGPGCARCRATEKAVREALREMGKEATVVKVEDIKEMIRYGISMTPAVAIDGTIRLAGKVPSVEEVKDLLSTSSG
ncbi:MAG: TM0996/MTH895 family glutaredoxin-like protein [Deltaproteobacteria bacterium]|jgi:small redox-active disulfide protein 2|nr:MAG: TM0996/MTH895 family glutaredoxin-like protein [Deltaproteobacteria bacterium]